MNYLDMGMHVSQNDSSQAKRIIEAGKEITRLIRKAVNADRHSRGIAAWGNQKRWTAAAKNRDERVATLRLRLEEIAKEI